MLAITNNIKFKSGTEALFLGILSIISALLLVLIGTFITLSTFNPSKAHAEASSSEDAEVSLDVNSVINIATPATTTLNCTPGATSTSATLCTTTANINVATNNLVGYTLQMNATNGSPTALTNSSTSPSTTVPTLTQAYSSANFPTNYWGYTGGLDKSSESGGYNCASNYCPILAYDSGGSYAPNHTIKITDAPATTSTTNITFGSKVDISKPSGTYSTSVTFTAVANAIPAPPITNGMNMQDITSENCASTPTDVTYTVTDTRGGGTDYTVAKLQDGNCWMTQNLALGGSTAMNLTQADSNVGSGGFTLPASVSEGDWANSTTTPEFFNYAGNYDDSSTKYGNFYNWPAATAGTNPSSGDAQYSICPKGWRLPSASTDYTNSEFYKMLNPYITTGSWTGLRWSGVTITNFTNAPVSLVFSGYYHGGTNFILRGQGDYGEWYSATALNSSFAFRLNADSYGGVYPREHQSYSKNSGFSIRCLVSGGA